MGRWMDGLLRYDTKLDILLQHLAESLNIWANWSLILDITTLLDISFQYFQSALTLFTCNACQPTQATRYAY